ncbi:hypothetical protein ACHHV8_29560 [Paenibacillus sp. TAB 01]|uniref:hypothetical protein n=1 Tax=Paenibacillus sp. TAB 01 TaxID=3368988 RepID=UPI0037504374
MLVKRNGRSRKSEGSSRGANPERCCGSAWRPVEPAEPYAWVRAESGRAQVLRLFGCPARAALQDKQGGFFCWQAHGKAALSPFK